MHTFEQYTGRRLRPRPVRQVYISSETRLRPSLGETRCTLLGHRHPYKEESKDSIRHSSEDPERSPILLWNLHFRSRTVHSFGSKVHFMCTSSTWLNRSMKPLPPPFLCRGHEGDSPERSVVSWTSHRILLPSLSAGTGGEKLEWRCGESLSKSINSSMSYNPGNTPAWYRTESLLSSEGPGPRNRLEDEERKDHGWVFMTTLVTPYFFNSEGSGHRESGPVHSLIWPPINLLIWLGPVGSFEGPLPV